MIEGVLILMQAPALALQLYLPALFRHGRPEDRGGYQRWNCTKLRTNQRSSQAGANVAARRSSNSKLAVTSRENSWHLLVSDDSLVLVPREQVVTHPCRLQCCQARALMQATPGSLTPPSLCRRLSRTGPGSRRRRGYSGRSCGGRGRPRPTGRRQSEEALLHARATWRKGSCDLCWHGRHGDRAPDPHAQDAAGCERRQTDGDRQDRQAGRQAGRQADTRTHRHTDTQKHRETQTES